MSLLLLSVKNIGKSAETASPITLATSFISHEKLVFSKENIVLRKWIRFV
jgi:hypothetical protein